MIGLAASGRTPYAVSAVEHAAKIGCATVSICNTPECELSHASHVAIEIDTGPEILTGSTRLKAGTSQKMVLNMLSTAAFTRLGKVCGNFMVDVQATNEKLKRRARRIIRETTGVSEDETERLLDAAEGSVKVAVVMGKSQVSAGEAARMLAEAGGSVRKALEIVGTE